MVFWGCFAPNHVPSLIFSHVEISKVLRGQFWLSTCISISNKTAFAEVVLRYNPSKSSVMKIIPTFVPYTSNYKKMEANASTKKCITFGRVSTIGQDVSTQKPTLFEMAKRDGYNEGEIIELFFVESAIKEVEGEREFQRQLKETIETQEITCVYAFELSRLGRNMLETLTLIDLFKKKKINLKTYTEGIQLFDFQGNLNQSASIVINVMATLAESEMAVKKERMLRGKIYKQAQGKYIGGKIPYGYQVVDKQYVINEEEAEVIRYIYEQYNKGKSINEISEQLLLKGKTLGTYLIKDILDYQLYSGEVTKTRNGYDKVLPKIISPSIIEKTRQLRQSRKRGESKNINLLRGIGKCSVCGGYLQLKGKFYVCNEATKSDRIHKIMYGKLDGKCQNKAFSNSILVDSVVDYFAKTLAYNKIMGLLGNEVEIKVNSPSIKIEENKLQIQQHTSTIEEIQQKTKEKISSYRKKGGLFIEMIEPYIEQSEREIATLRKEINKIERENLSLQEQADKRAVKEYPSYLTNVIEPGKAGDKQAYDKAMQDLISMMFEYVTISNYGSCNSKFHSTKQKVITLKPYLLDNEIQIICEPLSRRKNNTYRDTPLGEINEKHIVTCYMPTIQYIELLGIVDNVMKIGNEIVVINGEQYIKFELTSKDNNLLISKLHEEREVN